MGKAVVGFLLVFVSLFFRRPGFVVAVDIECPYEENLVFNESTQTRFDFDVGWDNLYSRREFMVFEINETSTGNGFQVVQNTPMEADAGWTVTHENVHQRMMVYDTGSLDSVFFSQSYGTLPVYVEVRNLDVFDNQAVIICNSVEMIKSKDSEMLSVTTSNTYLSLSGAGPFQTGVELILTFSMKGVRMPGMNRPFQLYFYKNNLLESNLVHSTTFKFSELVVEIPYTYSGGDLLNRLYFVLSVEMDDLMENPLLMQVDGEFETDDIDLSWVEDVVFYVITFTLVIGSLLLVICCVFGTCWIFFKVVKNAQDFEEESSDGSGELSPESGDDKLRKVLEEPNEQDYEKRREILKQEDTCVICMDHRSVVTFESCNHKCVCEGCYDGLKKSTNLCCICRVPIKKVKLDKEMIEKDKQIFNEKPKKARVKKKGGRKKGKGNTRGKRKFKNFELVQV